MERGKHGRRRLLTLAGALLLAAGSGAAPAQAAIVKVFVPVVNTTVEVHTFELSCNGFTLTYDQGLTGTTFPVGTFTAICTGAGGNDTSAYATSGTVQIGQSWQGLPATYVSLNLCMKDASGSACAVNTALDFVAVSQALPTGVAVSDNVDTGFTMAALSGSTGISIGGVGLPGTWARDCAPDPSHPGLTFCTAYGSVAQV